MEEPGTGVTIQRDRLGITALAVALVVVVVLQGALAVALFTLQVSDWSLANKLLDHFAQLDVLIAGGLLALTRPANHG
jgi:hypothetical protein